MSENVSRESVSEIALILAKGYLRYRKSRRFRDLDPSQNSLDCAPEPSGHVTVVNTQRTEDK